MSRSIAGAVLLACLAAAGAPAQEPQPPGSDSVTVEFVDAELRAVVQALAPFLPKPLVAANVPALRVSLGGPGPVPRREVPALLRGLLQSQNLELFEEESYFGIRARAPLAPQLPAQSATAAIELFVLRLRHAMAPDVAATVNLLFGGSGEFSGRTGLSGGTLSEQLRPLPPLGAPSPAANDPPARATPGAALAGPVTIVPDERTNSLLIRAGAADFQVLRSAIEQLDIRPLQVLIEVLIVEVRRDAGFSLGADILVPQQDLPGGGSAGGQVNGGGLGDLVIRLMKLGKGDVDAVIRMAQSRGIAEIVSRPVLLASNNAEARFLIGSQRPFVQISRVQPTDGATRDQVVQYRDVGTKLTVRPTINQDGYVSLVIQQEINAATDETQFDAPIISTREAVTQVLARDGQTIVIGGLSDQQRGSRQSGVPILSGIPILGGLFGTATRRSTAIELYLFITPRILRTDDDADRVTQPRLSGRAEAP